MADIQGARARGLDVLVINFTKMAGTPPWAGDAKPEELAAWNEEWATMPDAQKNEPNPLAHLSAGVRLTRDIGGLASWVAYGEEVAAITSAGKEVPKKLQANAQKSWDREFKEPKTKERQQNIQMFLALSEGKRADYGNFPPGILWATLDDPMSLEEIGAAVVAKYEKSKYVNDPIGRAATDVKKFNKGSVFACQGDSKPPHAYEPKGGFPSKKKAAAEAAEPATEEAAATG